MKKFERNRLQSRKEKACTGKQLAEALSRAKLTSKEAKAWRNEITQSR